jgi:hypothetical protein
MLFLLQNNHVEAMTGRLALALRRAGFEFADFSLLSGEPLPPLPDAEDGAHFYYGSTGLLRRLHAMAEPSVFDTPAALDQRLWQQHRDDLLNPAPEILTFGELRTREFTTPYFVRPVCEQKAFGGQVIETSDLAPLYQSRKGLVRVLPDDLVVAVAPVVAGLRAEYRFVVLDGRARLGSRYRLDGVLSLSDAVPPEVWARANQLAARWLPAPFIVMDVAVLADGTARLIEFNSVHSSGLYAIRGEDFAALVTEAHHTRDTAACQ